MDCVTLNLMRNVLHSRWIVVLWLEWGVLQCTVSGSYFTAGGQSYCVLNGVCYSGQCVECAAQQVDSVILGLKKCVTVNIMWKVLQSR